MNVYLLGTYHWDPFGRDCLINALRALQKHHRESPCFVAVEYNSQHIDQLRKQRSLFRDLVSNQEPRPSEEELDVYEYCIAYEADAHQELFPHPETVWLDDGRNTDLSKLDCYATGVLRMFLGITDNQLAGSVEKLSHYLRSQQDAPRDDLEREKKFAEVVKSKLNQEKEWAIVIVGRAHTNLKTQGSMANLLMRDGVQFDMLDLADTIL